MYWFRYNPAPDGGTRHHDLIRKRRPKAEGVHFGTPSSTIRQNFRLGDPHATSDAGVLLAELVHATTRVHDLLLARVERVAVRADFNLQVLSEGRHRLKGVPAAALHGDHFVLGMNAGLHGFYWAPLMGAPLGNGARSVAMKTGHDKLRIVRPVLGRTMPRASSSAPFRCKRRLSTKPVDKSVEETPQEGRQCRCECENVMLLKI